jgi:hypothetical protein
MEFCKAFNAQTQGVEPGLPLPVVITAFADKSFTFIMKTPPATVLIKKAASSTRVRQSAHTDKVGKITRAQLEEIAKTKMKDLTAADLDARRAHHRRLGPLDGHHGGGSVIMAKLTKRKGPAPQGRHDQAVPARRRPGPLVKELRHRQVRRVDRRGRATRRRRQEVRPGRSRRGRDAATAPARPSAWPCSPRAPRPKKPRPPAPTSSAWTTWPSESRPATCLRRGDRLARTPCASSVRWARSSARAA